MAEERRWTWEDIVHLPELERPEIIDGKPYYRAAARKRHGNAAGRLFARLEPLERRTQRSGWWISIEADVQLGQQILRPDLAGWRKERMPELTDEWPTLIIPDWVCEILSPTTARYDRGTKGEVYAQAGIPWYWLVDPQERMVEVWELTGTRWTLHGCFGDDQTLALPPFDGLEFEVGQLFGPRGA